MPKAAKKLTPTQLKRELEALDWCYQNSGLDHEAYLKKRNALVGQFEREEEQ